MNDNHNAQSTSGNSIRLSGGDLDFASLVRIFGCPVNLDIDDSLWERVTSSRKTIEKIAQGEKAVYGVNTGFGNLCTKRIHPDQLEQLQENLILSHAVGVGGPTPPELVRLMMLFKVAALCRGHSGVRCETIRMLAALLSADYLPIIPLQGSLGASGDLAPLAHMVLPLLGKGEVLTPEGVVPGERALEQLGLKPTQLGAKEGLALINGTQFMSAHAAGVIIRGLHLLKHADIVAATSLEGLRGSLRPFMEKLHELRPHPGCIDTAENVRRLMDGSRILESHVNCNRVQDPYSLRCIPQVHGAARQALQHALQVVTTEINSVTDNPVIFADGDTISGGLFHGEPLALILDYLAVAVAELGNISERRIYLLLSGYDGLPELLMKETGLNSAFMIPQYTAAALVSENKILCHPASVDSIPSALGQEDHVSMGSIAGTKAWRVVNHVETILAIEQLCAAQALDYRAPIEPGIGVKIAHKVIRNHVEHSETDHLLGADIEESLRLVRSERIVAEVENELGALK